MVSRYKAHQELVKKLRLALQEEFPTGRSFERHVGLFYRRNGTPIKINRKGMSDVWFVLNGLHFELECKTGSGALTEEQKMWRNVCETMGAYFIEARDTKEVIEEIKRVLHKKTQSE